MSEKESNESSCSNSERHYMRISNLPWAANQQDIKNFFKDIQIPEGGISIYKRDVFIAFLSNQDLTEALKKNGNILLGTKIYLSSLERPDFYRLRHRNVRRVLLFSRRALIGGFALRRIRPTFQARDEKNMFSIFNPEENELKCIIPRNLVEQNTVRRKIKPTKIDSVSKYESSNFEDKYSFETSQCSKKIKLDENIFELIPLCKA